MDTFVQAEIVGTVMRAVIGVMVGAMWAYLVAFIKEQRAENKRNAEFRHSMELAEITRMFQRAVEDKKPITFEHLDATYKAYHGDGCNGAGTLMYERIREFAKVVTKVDEDSYKIGGTE